MHNTALRELAKLSPSSLRLPEFPLRLSRADPKPIIASFFDSEEVTERKPDLVCTSVSAACGTHKISDEGETSGKDDEANEEHIAGEPTTAFTWPQVLSSAEMKTFRVKLSGPAKNVIDEQRQFTGPGIEPHVQYTFVVPETPATIYDQLESGAKRLRSKANDGILAPRREFAHPPQLPALLEKPTLRKTSMRVYNSQVMQWRCCPTAQVLFMSLTHLLLVRIR